MRVLALVFLLLFPTFTYAAVTEVGSGSQRMGPCETATTTSVGCTFPQTVNSGEFLVVGGALWNGSTLSEAALTVTSDCSAPLATFTGYDSGSVTVFIAYGFATSTTTCTVTVTSANGATYITMGQDVFTGVNVTPLDADGGVANGNSTSPSENITTLTAALIVGIMSRQNSAATTIDPGVSLTQIFEEEDNASWQAASLEFKIAASPNTYVVDWTLTPARAWMTYAASFKPSGAVAGAVGHKPIMQ